MRVLLSGSSGLLGRHLAVALRAAGDEVVPLLRSQSRAVAGPSVRSAPDGRLDPRQVSGFDAIVHLAGEPVAALRWTERKKRAILNSRVDGTRHLALAAAEAAIPPKVFLCASGINIYGDRGAAVLDENEPRGEGFLADVCEGWEAATLPLRSSARVVSTRIGVVLSREGGALRPMLPVFGLGLGGPLAGGEQFVPWITLRDTVRAFDHLLRCSSLAGPVNLVAPHPVRNRDFARALGHALHRPAALPVPGWALRLLLGQLAKETVLASVRAVPARLLADGFRFVDDTLGPALREVLSTRSPHPRAPGSQSA